MKQINDKVIEEMFEKYMTENYGDDYDLGDDLIAHLEYKAAKGGFKAAISLLSDTEVYVEVKTEDELPNKKGPYFVKVKNPEGSAMVFKDYDIYMWLDGPEFPQVEMWKNTFSVWLRKVKLSELLNGK